MILHVDSYVDICENTWHVSGVNMVGLGINFYPLGTQNMKLDKMEGIQTISEVEFQS